MYLYAVSAFSVVSVVSFFCCLCCFCWSAAVAIAAAAAAAVVVVVVVVVFIIVVIVVIVFIVVVLLLDILYNLVYTLTIHAHKVWTRYEMLVGWLLSMNPSVCKYCRCYMYTPSWIYFWLHRPILGRAYLGGFYLKW